MIEPVTPLPGATVMLLRDGDRGLEVLMLRRSDRAGFVPGAHVFPGGVVDLGDHHERYRTHWRDGTPADDLAHRVAAAREALEEAGVLLATPDAPGDRSATPSREHPLLSDLATFRTRIERGELDLAEVTEQHGLRLALHEMAYIARWVTPEESPRRYDARFYVTAMPEGQDASADDREVSDAEWWRPEVALDAWQTDRILLIEPTVASLELLAEFDAVESALGSLRGRQPREETG